MKQTTDLRQDALKWWKGMNGTFEQFSIGEKYFKGRKASSLTGREIQEAYEKETSISNDSLESKIYFIDGDEGDEIFLRFRANDDENFDVCSFNCCEAENVMQEAKEICEAVNNYNALKDAAHNALVTLEAINEYLNENHIMNGAAPQTIAQLKSALQKAKQL